MRVIVTAYNQYGEQLYVASNRKAAYQSIVNNELIEFDWHKLDTYQSIKAWMNRYRSGWKVDSETNQLSEESERIAYFTIIGSNRYENFVPIEVTITPYGETSRVLAKMWHEISKYRVVRYGPKSHVCCFVLKTNKIGCQSGCLQYMCNEDRCGETEVSHSCDK